MVMRYLLLLASKLCQRDCVYCSSVLLLYVSREVSTSYEVMDIIRTTMRQRAEGVTNIHSHSSRSHLVVSITVVSAAYVNSISSTPMMSPQGSPYKSSSSITVHVSYSVLCLEEMS